MPVDTCWVVRIPWFASHRKLTQIDLSKRELLAFMDEKDAGVAQRTERRVLGTKTLGQKA